MPEEKFSFINNPGPCRYESDKITALNPKGKYIISKFKSPGVAVINPIGNKDNLLNNKSSLTNKSNFSIPGPA